MKLPVKFEGFIELPDDFLQKITDASKPKPISLFDNPQPVKDETVPPAKRKYTRHTYNVLKMDEVRKKMVKKGINSLQRLSIVAGLHEDALGKINRNPKHTCNFKTVSVIAKVLNCRTNSIYERVNIDETH